MRTNLILACAAVMVVSSGVANACSVPVFRYALERWQADPYVGLLFHEGPLSEEQQALVDQLRDYSRFDSDDEGKITPVNLFVETFDVNEPLHDEVAAIWKRHEAAARASKAGLPWLVLRFPWESQLDAAVWSGGFTEANLDRLLVSPARNEIASRILNGDSAVWVVVGSGDVERDKKLVRNLEDELFRISELALLPEVTPEDEKFLSPAGPKLQVKFSVLLVQPDDPRERLLVESLRKAARTQVESQIAEIESQLTDRRRRLAELEQDPETDPENLANRKKGFANIEARMTEAQEHLRKSLDGIDGPLIAPVLGRGRATAILYGDALVPAAYGDWCDFLLGPCSCEIKGQNPGFDLLISADWIGRISGEYVTEQALPPLTGPFATISATVENEPAPESEATGDSSTSSTTSSTAAANSNVATETASVASEGMAATTGASGSTHGDSAFDDRNLLLRNVALLLLGGFAIVLGAGVALQWKRPKI